MNDQELSMIHVQRFTLWAMGILVKQEQVYTWTMESSDSRWPSYPCQMQIHSFESSFHFQLYGESVNDQHYQ